ncbi:MAG: DNA topoisomerase subunit B [Acidimicrobiales bacterium]|nr:DNA topoisomerase subunit B [Acidimicrobiales bacterium]MDG2219173.1 DNA topoisomerase subunit B [Acidimicrobiales bacterium]
MTVTESSSYGASDITVLEGLEAVRKRPGMYIGSTGPTGLHHLVWEVVDNSVDEAMAGHCTRIGVTLTADGACEVSDDGRGIPVGKHPKYEDLTAAEVVLTVLHAGGKFGGEGYKVSGGLHGVGISVVNALSHRVEVEIDREGTRHAMVFGDGGELKERLAPTGDSPVVDGTPRTGTTVRFWPDPTIFDEIEFRFQTLIERFQMMAFLNRGLEIRVRDLRENARPVVAETIDSDSGEVDTVGDEQWVIFKYDGGIIDFVSHVNAAKDALFEIVGYFEGAETIDGNAHEAEIAFQWNTGFNSDGLHSFANGIATREGGMHEQGFRTALTRTVNAYARDKGILKDKDDNLQGEDIREGLTAIISVRISEPQFEGQTKAKLGNVSMRSLVERVTNERLAEWLEEHPGEAKVMVTKATNAARARMAASDARKAIRSKSLLDGAGMPDKLKDCSAKEPERRELFIVEGDSAGGSAVRARDPETQAILPIRGKILNVERARIDKMLKNNEVQTLITAIGAGFADDFDIDQARYHKVILLADADVDGSHIRTLLLTFFFRQMRPLVEAGFVYIAQPPLYSTKVSNKETVYLKDDTAKDEFLASRPTYNKDFQRLKGLGEMDWDELRDTTMDVGSRSLLQVSVDQAVIADEVMSILMGDDVEQRKNFIVTNAREVRNLDF